MNKDQEPHEEESSPEPSHKPDDQQWSSGGPMDDRGTPEEIAQLEEENQQLLDEVNRERRY